MASVAHNELQRVALPASRPGDPTWEVVDWYPPQGEWSEAEYLSLDVGRLIEYEDGCLEFLPMPTAEHQLIVQELFLVLNALVQANSLGYAFVAPLPVKLGRRKYREPDVVFARPERLETLKSQPNGADLVIEVVSPGDENRIRDLETKRADYAAAGIPEYWIVDPDEHRIIILTLDHRQYRSEGVYEAGSRARSVVVPGFEVEVDRLFSLKSR